MVSQLLSKITKQQPKVRLMYALAALSILLLAAVATSSMLMTMSVEQHVASNLGDNQQRADAPCSLALGDNIDDCLSSPGDPERFSRELISQDFYTDADPSHRMTYAEGDWASHGSSYGLTLKSGRWPTSPGEIVATTPSGISEETEVSAFSSNLKVNVVGTVTNEFMPKASAVYAAPGTWDLTTTPVSPSSVGARPMLLDNQSSNPSELERTMNRIAHSDNAELSAKEAVKLSYLSKQSLEEQPPKSLLDEYSFFFGAFAFVLPLFFSAFLTTTQRRALKTPAASLHQLGIARKKLWSIFHLRLLFLVLSISTCAIITGALIPHLFRDQLANLGSVPGRDVTLPWKWYGLLLVSAVLPPIFSALTTALPVQFHKTHTTEHELSLKWKRASAGAIPTLCGITLVTVLFAGVVGPEIFTTLAPIPTLAVAFAVALLLTISIKSNAPTSPSRLARRFLSSHRILPLIGLGLLSSTVGIAIFSSSLAASMTASEAESYAPIVPPDQAILTLPAEADSVRGTAQNSLITQGDLPEPISVQQLSAGLPMDPNVSGAFGVISVHDSDSWERLTDEKLTSNERQTLERGGVLVRDKKLVDASHTQITDSNGKSHTLDAQESSFGNYWEKQVGGVILEDTAQQLELPTNSPLWVFDGLSTQKAGHVPKVANELGIPPEDIQLSKGYETETPISFYISLTAALLSAIAIALVVSRGLNSSMKALHTAFFHLGLSRDWSFKSLSWAISFICFGSLVIGTFSGLAPLAAFSFLLGDGFLFAIDWTAMGLTIIAVLLGTVIGALTQQKRLSQR